MTFSRASLSEVDVEDVEATAAGTVGLRAAAGGSAACWRVAGAIAALGTADAAGATVGLSVVLGEALSAVFSAFSVLGTTLRAIGRAFGIGTLCLAAACFVVACLVAVSFLVSVSFATACAPMMSASVVAKVVAMAVERRAAARADRITAFLCGESRKTSAIGSSLLNIWKERPVRGASGVDLTFVNR